MGNELQLNEEDKAFFENMLKIFARVKSVTWLGENDPTPDSYIGMEVCNGTEIYIVLDDDDIVVDYESEKARLSKELCEATECLEKIRKNLSNENFITRAPVEVVDREYTREKNLAQRVEQITTELSRIEKILG